LAAMSPMLVLSILVASVGYAPEQPVVSGEMSCTPFRWASIEAHERGALMVPITLNGHF
jgi:hypothetical protein